MRDPKASPDSVFSEPHLQAPVKSSSSAPIDSVWMEPLQNPDGSAKGKQLYQKWFALEQAKQNPTRIWVRTLLLSLLAGPLAILTTFFTQHPGAGILLLVVAGPVIEEMGKVLLPLMVMEKNPAKFSSRMQLLACAVAGGLAFGCIENLLYLHVYIQDASPALIRWRWTVCLFLHTGCSFIAGCGLAKSWRESVSEMQPPKFESAMPLLLTAVIIHGSYNFIALFLNATFE
ncbi:PrsW family glutamic-type intramembrane protease [Kiritimatiellaeota bacterium B1221]|nr:PrsW family glutamic-type intramembrane protease [Kiritimatiellaeota bacterium B1221]